MIVQNILMVTLSPPVVKISDFGISKLVSDGTALRTAMMGTPGYTAPEVMDFLPGGTSMYTTAVDIWSLRCIVYAMITKEIPFPTPRELLSYAESRISFPTGKLAKKQASWGAIRFIVSVMVAQPDDRKTAQQALRDP